MSGDPRPPRRAPHVLIIDDEPEVRRTTRTILELAGYTVAEAPDGRQGLAEYHRRPADAVITDIFMPNEDGMQTLRAFRHAAPDVPIIALSGGDSTGLMDLREHAERLGARRSLMKPATGPELLAALAAVLGRA